jgi:hypothetical protein
MKGIPESSAIAILQAEYHCWRRFTAECRRSGVIEKALLLCLGDQPRAIAAGRFTAFEILEPEAKAWLGYFRRIGAIASVQPPAQPAQTKKTEFDDCKVWSETVNDYVLL